jgi:hypothetical protein
MTGMCHLAQLFSIEIRFMNFFAQFVLELKSSQSQLPALLGMTGVSLHPAIG